MCQIQCFEIENVSQILLLLQISFLIPIDTVPGRMGFLTTLFLCMINILNWSARYSPKSGQYVTAMIYWILYCLIFIIGAIVEYALILYFKKNRKLPTLDAEMKISSQSGKNVDKLHLKERFRRLDRWMMLLFPMAFSIFSIIFWSTC